MMRYHSSTNATPINFCFEYSKSIRFELHCFYLHFSFCRGMKNKSSERLRFQRSEFVHRLVTDMFSDFSTSTFLQLFKGRERNLVLQEFSGLIVNIC